MSELYVGAVVSNCENCAEVGGQILDAGGSHADAAIATLICEGVILPHSMGLGGGFVATMYTKATGKVETLIARETAPANAHRDMFLDRPITGAIAAGVPSELCGYASLHKKYGKLPWRDLFEPAITLCMNGHRVSKHLANAITMHSERIIQEPSMAEVFINPNTNEPFKEGEILRRPCLGETLKVIAEEGPDVIYAPGGRIGRMLVEDIQALGGIITEEDLQNYQVRWEKPIAIDFVDSYTIYTTPLPTCGVILAFICNVMSSFYTDNLDNYWQRSIETFKHAYGYRSHLGDILYEPEVIDMYSKLVDRNFADSIRKLIKDNETCDDFHFYGGTFMNEEDHGTANIAVLAPNGDAIAVTSTVNSRFGAKVRSRQTGIILNDEMDDFSTPGKTNFYGIPSSSANFIKPGKQPLSSACPSIVLDKHGNLQLLLGGAGGSKITTAVAQSILRYLVLNETLDDAVNSARIHHQLMPMQLDVEPRVPKNYIDKFVNVGHRLNYLPADKAFSALTAIGLRTGVPQPVCDRRRIGSSVLVFPN